MKGQKLNEILRNIDLIKHDFSSNTKKITSSYPYYFGLKQKFERNGTQNSSWGSNWIRKLLYGLIFYKFKIFGMHAFLHDAAGSVKSTTHKGPGYYFVLPRFPSSSFLGHVTGLFFCSYVKIISSSVYALFDC